MPGDFPDTVDIQEALSMLAVVGVMYAIVVFLMILFAEPRRGLPRRLREIIGRIFVALRSLR
ncbi:MAG TPA: hypothetical protein VF104_07935 [Burkholderiales bacterium]